MTHWLRDEDPITALIAYSQEVVLSLFPALFALGIFLPRNLSLMTFSDDPFRQFGPMLGTMLLPEREIGRKSVELLLEKTKTRCKHSSRSSSRLSWFPATRPHHPARDKHEGRT